ncbi:hypothetical protein KC19_2G283400 [Ceratodon purpureus]|uniref:Uncharacterized protein n=1 Tax=Ceratodon purpureus TaxID=3225 RepID=A0A8T0IZ38_CERPU|nr:hypothetical protein KC19_2G283400 [Ceratodon purpureus]
MSSAWPRECCPTDHTSCRWSHDENQVHSPFGSRVRETDPCASSIPVCSVQSGEPCASPPDWANHPCLKNIAPQDRRAFREAKLAEWLGGHVVKAKNECFTHYIVRCIAAAEQELKVQKKVHIGDDYLHLLDKLVFKLFYGARIAQGRQGMKWGVGTEELVLQLLREECAYLISQGLLKLDPCKFKPSTTPAWPNRDDVALHTAQRVPHNLDNFVEMDSR